MANYEIELNPNEKSLLERILHELNRLPIKKGDKKTPNPSHRNITLELNPCEEMDLRALDRKVAAAR